MYVASVSQWRVRMSQNVPNPKNYFQTISNAFKGKSFTSVFIFVNCMEKECCTKFCGNLIGLNYKVLNSTYVTLYTRTYFLRIFCYFYGENTSIIKLYRVFDHFSQTCEVAKSWTIKLYLCVSDVIHAKEQTKFVNCGLHVNFWNFL